MIFQTLFIIILSLENIILIQEEKELVYNKNKIPIKIQKLSQIVAIHITNSTKDFTFVVNYKKLYYTFVIKLIT